MARIFLRQRRRQCFYFIKTRRRSRSALRVSLPPAEDLGHGEKKFMRHFLSRLEEKGDYMSSPLYFFFFESCRRASNMQKVSCWRRTSIAYMYALSYLMDELSALANVLTRASRRAPPLATPCQKQKLALVLLCAIIHLPVGPGVQQSQILYNSPPHFNFLFENKIKIVYIFCLLLSLVFTAHRLILLLLLILLSLFIFHLVKVNPLFSFFFAVMLWLRNHNRGDEGVFHRKRWWLSYHRSQEDSDFKIFVFNLFCVCVSVLPRARAHAHFIYN